MSRSLVKRCLTRKTIGSRSVMVVILKKALTVVLSDHRQITVDVHGNFVVIFNQIIYSIHGIIKRAIEKAGGI